MLTLLVIIIVLALIFDYINGFHDAANSIANVVSTKVLSPVQAVIWAAFFNFAAFFLAEYVFHSFGIGDSVSKIVTSQFINLEVILSGLLAAIVWNLITWWFGIPSSSSHTLIGGFMGAAIACNHGFSVNGISVVNVALVSKVFAFILLAPFIGMFMAFLTTILVVHIFKNSNPYKAEKKFKKIQLLSSAALSLGHGGNDAQKVMGIIGAAIIYYDNTKGIHLTFMQFVEQYSWVPFCSFLAIGLGTLSGGWKIIKTMGTKITKITPLEGVCADTAGAITLYITQWLGIPVSTTHTITGSIIGVGATKRLSAVRWGVTINLLWAWIITIPISALMAAGFYYLLHFILSIIG
jgi:inorganic phosphate transporter, PiT family